jgi:hypothetical protein
VLVEGTGDAIQCGVQAAVLRLKLLVREGQQLPRLVLCPYLGMGSVSTAGVQQKTPGAVQGSQWAFLACPYAVLHATTPVMDANNVVCFLQSKDPAPHMHHNRTQARTHPAPA